MQGAGIVRLCGHKNLHIRTIFIYNQFMEISSRFHLLSRDEFRNNCFTRDNYLCVNCGQKAVDCHHILERRLFSNGGYYLENGASVCADCHILAEKTILSCQELRDKIGIKDFPIPDHLYKDQEYDKWGNPLLPNGMRMKGELFNDPSVQKILQDVLRLFTDKIKYPRTYHLPWSPGLTKDDRIISSIDIFQNKNVVVSVKLDGESSSLYADGLHSRSLEYKPHESRNLLRAFHASIAHHIPEGWRICGENLYAKHSIHYKNLKNHFMVFSIWNEKNECLSWNETKEYCEILNLQMVPVLYEGIFDEKLIKSLYSPIYDEDEMEGYVVRLSESFHYKDFRNSVAKYVRKNHVNADAHHWLYKAVIPNIIKNDI